MYSVQGSDVLMTVFARPGVVRYVFRFPFDRYVEDVLFLLLFLESTSVCVNLKQDHTVQRRSCGRVPGGARLQTLHDYWQQASPSGAPLRR